jgi:hypothetical protein
VTYDPEKWMESTLRTLKDYATENFNTGIYSIVMEFPGAIVDNEKLPMKKTIIHFELDDVVSRPVGFGDGAFADNYDEVNHEITPQYATMHRLAFDVGVWASDRSGGTTARMRARQTLEFMFGMNAGGINRLRDFSDAGDGVIEIVGFSGGRFVLDTSANDTRLFRMVDCLLEVRVFSRTALAAQEPIPTIETISYNPDLTILG